MPTAPQDWQSQLKTALMQDPKKTGVLSVLFVVLLIMGGRLMLGGGAAHPAVAAGSIAMRSSRPGGPPSQLGATAVSSPGFGHGFSRNSAQISAQSSAGSEMLLRKWLTAPLPATVRNDFLVKSTLFPTDASKPAARVSDGVFWTELEKSLALQADQTSRRQEMIESLKRQAATIRPESTMMGERPRAMVNGVLLAEGDTASGFRVLKIEPRGIIVERQGVRLVVPMR